MFVIYSFLSGREWTESKESTLLFAAEMAFYLNIT